MGEVYEINGFINGAFPLNCSRCLEDLDLPTRIEFEELLLLQVSNELDTIGSTTHFNSEEKQDVTLVNPNAEFDSTKWLSQILDINLPTHPHCKPDCKGLCQGCGENLNEGPCQCPTDKVDGFSPFSTLIKLKKH